MSGTHSAVDALFRPVSDVETRLRALLFGAAGSGKTTTALRIALGLVGGTRSAGSICLLDSERGSAAKAGRDLGAAFVHAEVSAFKGLAGRRDLVEHDPRIYIEAIKAASERYEVVVLDSLSHAWQACLELCDLAAKRFGGNSHKAWADVTPIWRELISTILEAPAHIICTSRSKTKWGEAEGRNGKSQPKAIGLDPELRQGTEYEFDILLRLDGEHTAYVEKARSAAFDGGVFERPGEGLGVDLLAWLKGGEDPLVSLAHQLADLGLTVAQLDTWRVANGKPTVDRLGAPQHRQIVAWLASNPGNAAQVRAASKLANATPAEAAARRAGMLRNGTSAPPAAVEDADLLPPARPGRELLADALAAAGIAADDFDRFAAANGARIIATMAHTDAAKAAEWLAGKGGPRVRAWLATPPPPVASAAPGPLAPDAPSADEVQAALEAENIPAALQVEWALYKGIRPVTNDGARALWLSIMHPADDEFAGFMARWDATHAAPSDTDEIPNW